MEIQWKSCRATISFDSFPVVINLQFEMPKPKLESPSKDSEPKTDATEAQTEPSRKRSSIVILDGEQIEEF